MTDVHVLLVEDNPLDVTMIKRALKLGGLRHEPLVVSDGGQAIAMLTCQNYSRDVPLPDLVVLDLNLIKVDGDEVLRFIRETPALDRVSVAIVSSAGADVTRLRHADADCCFTKPSDYRAFEKLGREILFCYEKSKRRHNGPGY